MTANPSPGKELSFSDRTLKALAFLLDLGFQVTKRDDSSVRFESDDVFVNVFQGQSSYNVGLELGRLANNELYTLHEVLRYLAPARLDEIKCQATTAKALEQCLTAISSALASECQGLLGGESEAFESVRASVSESRHAATTQAQYGAIVDQADRAWEEKKRKHAADLYESAKPALDETRRKRLAYVRRSAR